MKKIGAPVVKGGKNLVEIELTDLPKIEGDLVTKIVNFPTKAVTK